MLLPKVLLCSLWDITCEAGVGCQDSLFTRLGFSQVERAGRGGLICWRMLKG